MIRNQLYVLALSLFSLSFTASAGTVFMSDLNGALWSGDPVTGVFNQIAPTKLASGTLVTLSDLAFSSNGTLYGDDATNLYTINTTTGLTTKIGALGAPLNALDYANGVLYGAAGANFYTVNTTTGATTAVNTTPDPGYYSSGDIEYANGTFYLTSLAQIGFTNDDLYTINPATGFGTLVGSNPVTGLGFPNVYGLAYTNNTMYGFTFTGQELSINLTTGASTVLFNGEPKLYGAAVLPVSTTPEPGTLGAMMLGLGGLAVWARRKRA